MTSSLVLLTLNEIEGSRVLWSRIPLGAVDEAVVVDGGSRDGTAAFYTERGLRVVPQERPGRGEAFRVGQRETSGEALVFFSPDGNEDPDDIPRLLQLLEEGADLAIASRFLPGGRNEEDDRLLRPRAWVNQVFSLLANLIFRRRGPYVSDTINGFRAIRRRALEGLHLDEPGFPIEYQMTIRAMKAGLRIAEIPTREGHRLGGVSKAQSLPVGIGHLKVLLREILTSCGR